MVNPRERGAIKTLRYVYEQFLRKMTQWVLYVVCRFKTEMYTHSIHLKDIHFPPRIKTVKTLKKNLVKTKITLYRI